jgi:Flp pilus assembly protein TadD
VQHNKYIASKIFFAFLVSLLVLFASDFEQAQAKTKRQSKSKRHSRLVKKHQPTKEEAQAAKEAAAREAAEIQLIEGKNIILARAYKLYDSGTSESLLGNYKYSILQLKLADELLKEHGQTNSSLAIVNLMALASSAQAGKDYSLARATYDRLLSVHPQDPQTLLGLAKVEAAQSNFNAAQNYIDRLLEINPNNAEGRLLADFIANKSKPAKR